MDLLPLKKDMFWQSWCERVHPWPLEHGGPALVDSHRFLLVLWWKVWDHLHLTGSKSVIKENMYWKALDPIRSFPGSFFPPAPIIIPKPSHQVAWFWGKSKNHLHHPSIDRHTRCFHVNQDSVLTVTRITRGGEAGRKTGMSSRSESDCVGLWRTDLRSELNSSLRFTSI